MVAGKDSGHETQEVPSDRQTTSPPTSCNEPTVLSIEQHASSGNVMHYVLPPLWSLAFALTDKQWRDLRERHKRLHPGSEHCSCPKRCKSNTLDEHWRYDREM